jgi:DNA-binding NarL/FixJ family response regulator
MFDLITDAIDNALSVVAAPLNGEVPTQRQIAKLISDGLTVASIAAAAGVAEEVIENLLEDL